MNTLADGEAVLGTLVKWKRKRERGSSRDMTRNWRTRGMKKGVKGKGGHGERLSFGIQELFVV